MRRVMLVVVFLGVLTTSGTVAGAATGGSTGTITGRVTAAAGAGALGGVSVEVYNPAVPGSAVTRVATGPDGRYSATNVPSGTYQVCFAAA